MSLKVQKYVTGPFAENTYIATDPGTSQAAVIDPGEGALDLWKRHEAEGETLQWILLTHAHLDHIWGLRDLKAAYPEIPIWLHRDDLYWVENFVDAAAHWGFDLPPAPMPDEFWEEGDEIKIGEQALRVLHTPGHSPGSVSLIWDEGVFTGDALFAGSVGRTDFPGSSAADLVASVREKLYALPEALPIHPGHMESSTIGHEKRYNQAIPAAD